MEDPSGKGPIASANPAVCTALLNGKWRLHLHGALPSSHTHPHSWRVQDISSAFKWTASSTTLSKGKLFLRKKMPKPMIFRTKNFLSHPEEPAVPTRPVPLQQRSSRHLSSLRWRSFLVITMLISVGEAYTCPGNSEGSGERLFPSNGRAFLFSYRKGAAKVFRPLKEIGREKGAGFDLQKKPAHCSKGGCKVQGHSVKEEKKKSIQSLYSTHQSDNIIACYVYSSLADAAAAFQWS